MASGRAQSQWNGVQIQKKLRRAAGRALVGIGMGVVVQAKVIANDPATHPTVSGEHHWTGTLVRSIHLAPVGWNGSGDAAIAGMSERSSGSGPDRRTGANVPNATTRDVKHTPVGVSLEAGSWLPYACVEEVGRGHRFMQPAVESMMGARSDAIVKAAVRAEGL